MLTKCATKDCSHRFKYFGVGLLYVKPRKSRTSSDPDLEFCWLCETCSRHESEVTLKSLPVVVGPASRRTA